MMGNIYIKKEKMTENLKNTKLKAPPPFPSKKYKQTINKQTKAPSPFQTFI